jgi:hypothetical protein
VELEKEINQQANQLLLANVYIVKEQDIGIRIKMNKILRKILNNDYITAPVIGSVLAIINNAIYFEGFSLLAISTGTLAGSIFGILLIVILKFIKPKKETEEQ